MAIWPPTGAQQAVDLVAAVMAGEPRADVETELRHWLARRDAALPEPVLRTVVEEVASGRRAVVLPEVDAPGRRVLAAH